MEKTKAILQEYKEVSEEAIRLDHMIRNEPIDEEREKLVEEYNKVNSRKSAIENVIDGPLAEAFIEAVRRKAPEMKEKFYNSKISESEKLGQKIEEVTQAMADTGYESYQKLFSRMANNGGKLTYSELNEIVILEDFSETTVFEEMKKVSPEKADEYVKLVVEVQNKKHELEKTVTVVPNGYSSKESYIESQLSTQRYTLEDMANRMNRNVCDKFGRAAFVVDAVKNGKTIDTNKRISFDRAEEYAWNEKDTSRSPLDSLKQEKARILDFVGDPSTFGEKYIESMLESYVKRVEKSNIRKTETEKAVNEHDSAIDSINSDPLFSEISDEPLTAENKAEYASKLVKLDTNAEKLVAWQSIQELNGKKTKILEELEEKAKVILSEIAALDESIKGASKEKQTLQGEIDGVVGKIGKIDGNLKPIEARKRNIFTRFIGLIKRDGPNFTQLMSDKGKLEVDQKNAEDKKLEEEKKIAELETKREAKQEEIAEARREANSDNLLPSLNGYSMNSNTRLLEEIKFAKKDIENSTWSNNDSIKKILESEPLLLGKPKEEVMQMRVKIKEQAEKLKTLLSPEDIAKQKEKYQDYKSIEKNKVNDSDVKAYSNVESLYGSVEYRIEEDFKNHKIEDSQER